MNVMLSALHFLIGAGMPWVGIDVLTGSVLSQNPINASNPSKLLMTAAALSYLLIQRPRQARLSVSRATLLFVLGAYCIYFIANTLDIFSFALNASDRTPSIASFLVTPLLLYVLPYLSVKSMLADGRFVESYIKGVALSLFALTVIAILQLNFLFGAIPPLANLYGDHLFKIVESRWGGWGSTTDHAPDFPLIGWQLRPAGSFFEPSVFASYVFLIAAPLFISLQGERVRFISKRTVAIFGLLVLLLLGLSLSATGVVAAVALIVYKLLVRFRFSARSMIGPYAVSLVVVGLAASLFSQKLGDSVGGNSSLETRFGGFVGAAEQLIHNPWGNGFRFSAQSLGQYIPQWAHNMEYHAQQENNWFVATFFGMQVATMIGIIPFCILLWIAYRELGRTQALAPAFSLKLLHVQVWTLLVSSFAAVQYQEPWFVYAVAIAYLFPQAGVALKCGRVHVRTPRQRTCGRASAASARTSNPSADTMTGSSAHST